MALPKLYDRIIWHNDTEPALNEDNLNAMSKGLDDVDDRLIDLAGTIMEDVPAIQHDLEILEPAIENIDSNVERAETAADNAEDSALKSEGYAIGEQDGVEVGPDSDYYQNNAKYYAEIANPPIENTVDFTDIISISDAINKAAKDVRLKVEPVQDLHGYTKPWVGGAGKNLLLNTATSTTSRGLTITKNDDGSIHISGTHSSDGDYYYQINNTPILKGTNEYILSGCNGGANTTHFMLVQDFVNNTNLGIVYDGDRSFVATANGVKAFIVVRSGQTIDKTFYPMIRLATVSDATYEPYENICPITGWDNAKVTRSGKNILPFDLATIKALNTTGTWNGNVYTKEGIATTVNSNGTLLLNGTATADVTISLAYDIEMLHDSILSGCPSGGAISNYFLAFEKKEKPWTRYATDVGDGATITVRMVDDNVVYFRVRSGQTVSNLLIKPMIRDVSITDATYEPYQGIETTISLGGTRYGGTLDVTSGVLTVKGVYVEYDGSEDESWTNSHGPATACMRVEIPLTGAKPNTSIATLMGTAITNQFKEKTPDETYNGSIGFSISQLINDSTVNLSVCQTGEQTMSLTDWKTYLASNPLQVVYELATPQTIQLTPTQVYLLYGYNTLYGDCGDISLTYDASGIIHIEEAKLDTETLKTIAAASSDFADFKARIAAL